MSRSATISRITNETEIQIEIELDGSGKIEVSTGLGFLDHMLTALAFHAGWDLNLIVKGDLDVDDHHTVEDCGIVLGESIATAMGSKESLTRYGSKYAPLDESLARTVVDFSGRPGASIDLQLVRELIGEVATENLTHFFQSMAFAGKFTLHVDVLKGSNDHHKAESAFKSAALAMKEALTLVSNSKRLPSTKGTL